MEINTFITEFNEKRACADISLPKYQNLLEKKKEIAKDTPLLVDGSIIDRNEVEISGRFINEVINQATLIDNVAQGTLSLSDHVKETLMKDFTNIMDYVTGDKAVEGFNDMIKTYLKKESGYGLELTTKSGRPGAGNNFFRLVTPDGDPDATAVYGSSNYSWVNVEDSLMYGDGLEQGLADIIRPTFIDRLLSIFSKKHYDKVYTQTTKSLYRNTGKDRGRKSIPEGITLTVEDFFNQVKLKVDQAENFKNHITTIFKQIRQAKGMGQTALLEALTSKLIIEVYEGALMAAGFNKYITFKELKDLEKKSPKGLSIDYPQNFARIIPEEVIEKKMKADELCIFDHYVILHFDPKKQNTKSTKNEIEEKKSKDPILFGLILDSQKLYYITDWVDEYCDLTWDKALEILGDKDKEGKHTMKFKK